MPPGALAECPVLARLWGKSRMGATCGGAAGDRPRSLPLPLGSGDTPREGPDGQVGPFCRGISRERREGEGSRQDEGLADWRKVGMCGSLLARLCVQMGTNTHEQH